MSVAWMICFFLRPRVWSSGRASASHAEDPGSIPRSIHTKYFKKWNLLSLCVMIRISNGVMESKGKQASDPHLERKEVAGST